MKVKNTLDASNNRPDTEEARLLDYKTGTQKHISSSTDRMNVQKPVLETYGPKLKILPYPLHQQKRGNKSEPKQSLKT